ncbi:hypothetical protein [Mycobacterium sp. NPDC006124]|uniref:hypothetical protein n=1 Tax=Mycobacterium sp. NPDC006124 TaxID=3156729 RepID=UPI0033AEA5E1
METLTFLGDITEDGDTTTPAIPGKRGRRPGRPGDDTVTPLLPDTRTVTVRDPWRVVDGDGKVYTPGETATVPLALAEEWLRNQWAV